MPLHGNDLPAWVFIALDQTVLGVNARQQSFGENLDALAVDAVHGKGVASENRLQFPARGDDRMGQRITRRVGTVVVLPVLGVQILGQRAAQIDIDHLESTADAENGQAARQCGIHQAPFHGVARLVDGLLDIGVEFLPEA
jgi:hypothetical protein